MPLNLKEIKLVHAKETWMVELLFLLLKNIRSFRQEQNIKEPIEVYCELTQKWKNELDTSFDFNFFLFSLTKSKVFFSSFELEKNRSKRLGLKQKLPNDYLFYIVELQPFGTLKFPQSENAEQTNLNTEQFKTELQKKLNYFEKEFKRAQNLLTNKNFIQKAPSDLVKSEKKKLTYFAEQKKKILEQLENNE